MTERYQELRAWLIALWLRRRGTCPHPGYRLTVPGDGTVWCWMCRTWLGGDDLRRVLEWDARLSRSWIELALEKR